MPAQLPPLSGVLQATSNAPPPDARLARADAVAILQAYFARLKKLPETRFGYAGNGLGVVLVSNRSNYRYVRLDATDGDVTEARNLPLLDLANDDVVLLRRELPGRAGPWQIIDWYGTATPPILFCDVPPVMIGGIVWTLFDAIAYKIDSLVVTTGSPDTLEGDGFALGFPQNALVTLGSGGAFTTLTSRYYFAPNTSDSALVFTGNETRTLGNATPRNAVEADRANRLRIYSLGILTELDNQEIRQPLQVYVDAVANQWYRPPAGQYPLGTEAAEVDWFFVGLTVYANISQNGGASWTKYALDNLGQLIPSRITNTTRTQSQFSYEAFGCNLTTGGSPFAPAYIIKNGTTPVYYVVCGETYDPNDPDTVGLPFVHFPDLVGTVSVAPKQNNTGFYIFVHTTHIGPQLDTGEYTSPWVDWNIAISNGSLLETIWTLWVWQVAPGGTATRKQIIQGAAFQLSAFDGTDEFGVIHTVVKPVVNQADRNEIYLLFLKRIGSFGSELYYNGIDLCDFSAGTLTNLNLPTESDDTITALDIVCTAAGNVFVSTFKNDNSQFSIWKYNGVVWTEDDITADIPTPGAGKLIYNHTDNKLYYVSESQFIGVSTNEGVSWTFALTTGGVFGANYVDTY